MVSTIPAQKTIESADFATSYAANADLTVILDYVRKKNPELSNKLPKLTQQYRKYMFLIGSGLFHNMSVPSDAVDQIWHAHILHTVLYADFCQNVAGRFIHHNPFGDNVSELDRHNAKLSLRSASKSVFGKNVFKVKGSVDCGYCGGCSSCAGDCGGAACGQGAIEMKAQVSLLDIDCASCQPD